MVAVAGESAKEMPIDVLMHMTRLESWCWGVRRGACVAPE